MKGICGTISDGHLGAVLLVAGLEFGAARGQALVPADGGEVGLQVLEHPPHGLGEAENRVGRLAARVGQAPDGVEGAVGVVAAVDEEQFLVGGQDGRSRQNGKGSAAAGGRARVASAPPDRITVSIMADNHFESGGEERVWDEYDWERFLQQQDRKTEKYMELLEKYLDDPNRDQIIAREMGWHHLLDENGKDWSANLDTLFTQRPGETTARTTRTRRTRTTSTRTRTISTRTTKTSTTRTTTTPTRKRKKRKPEDRYSQHPLYQAASALAVYVDRLFDDNDPAAQHPAVARLTTSATLANVKLAAALTDDDVDELGMTIAYLKRALKAITNALDATTQCETGKAPRRTQGAGAARADLPGARRHHLAHGPLPQRVAAALRAGALSVAAPQPVGGADLDYSGRLPLIFSFLLNGARDRHRQN